MRLGRLLRFGTLAVWLTAVTYYWWNFIPAEHAHVVLTHGRSSRWTPHLGDVIVLSGTGPGEMRQTGYRALPRPRSFGPLQFYDPATGQLLREVLTPADEILSVQLKPQELAIVVREGVVRSVDLTDPDKSFELPGVDPNSPFPSNPEGREWKFFSGREPHFNANIGTDPLPGGSPPGTYLGLWISEDERRYATCLGQHACVFDSATDDEICRIPLPRGEFPLLVKFSPGNNDPMVLERVDREHLSLSIWDSETGQLRQDSRASSIPIGELSRYGKWMIGRRNPPSILSRLVKSLPAGVTSRLQSSQFFFDLLMRLRYAPAPDFVVPTDTRTGRTLGPYRVPVTREARPDEWRLVADDRRGVLAIPHDVAIYCYQVPADRQWLRLLMYAAPPVIFAWSLLFLFDKWRHRRRGTAVPATPAT